VDDVLRFSFVPAHTLFKTTSHFAIFLQETSVEVVHYIGAGFAFVLGTVYEFMHAYVTFKMHPEVNGKGVFYARLVISVMSGAALIGSECVVLGILKRYFAVEEWLNRMQCTHFVSLRLQMFLYVCAYR